MWGCDKGGCSLSEEREHPPLHPPKRKGRGAFPPRPRTLAVCGSKSCAACGIRCGVHGFAMNPCESSPLATAPYYREAPVTLARRQTAYRMWHCCARRIVETGGRRKLGCTSTRWAERQRMIGAEANRLAEPLAASEAIPPRRHFHSGGTKVIRARDCQSKPFSWGFKGGILFCERESPL